VFHPNTKKLRQQYKKTTIAAKTKETAKQKINKTATIAVENTLQEAKNKQSNSFRITRYHQAVSNPKLAKQQSKTRQTPRQQQQEASRVIKF
jgi:hypothetical protein